MYYESFSQAGNAYFTIALGAVRDCFTISNASASMKFLILLLCLTASYATCAEPLNPLLGKIAADSIKALLKQSPPNTIRVRLLLLLGEDSFLKSGGGMGTVLDTAAFYSKEAETLSNRLHFVDGQIESMYLTGRIISAKGRKTAGETIIRAALTQAKRHGNWQLEAYGWYTLSNVLNRTAADIPAIIHCCQQARALYEKLKDKRKEAYMLKTIANMHLLQGRSSQAQQELEGVLGLYQASGYRQLHYTYDLLRGAHRQMGNYKEAMRYGIASVESAKATRDTSDINVFYWRLGQLCKELNQPKEALSYYAKALANARQLHDVGSVVDDAGEISRVLIQMHQANRALIFFTKVLRDIEPDIKAYGDNEQVQVMVNSRLGECYLALHEFDAAGDFYLKLVEMLRQGIGDDIEKMFVYQSVGEFYFRTKQYKAARSYLNSALLLHAQGGYVLGIADVHLLLFKVDSAQANFPAAIAHYQRFKALNDSVSTEARNNQLASLQIRYDTKKKERNITVLTNLSRMQQSSMRHWEFQRNAFLAGAILLALSLGLGYSRFRLKQRSNQLLESKQLEIKEQNQVLEEILRTQKVLLTEKEWMLKEIHHRVKNNLQIISSLLNSQSDFLREPAALVALQQSQNRVHAMALIHQKLYQSDNLTGVDMQGYIAEITTHLIGSYNRQGHIQQQVQVMAITLDVAVATPLGLIINEAVTNSLKYAFPLDRKGIISVELIHTTAPERYYLTIADNGVGMPPRLYVEGLEPEDVSVEDTSTLGLTIIKGLSKQIGAGLTIGPNNGNGVQIRLQFEGVSKPLHMPSATG